MSTKTRDAPATTPPPATKICPGCGDEKPIRQFRRRSRKTGARASRCNSCFAKWARRRRASKRRRDIGKFRRQVWASQSISQTDVFVRIMLKKFGGLERFAEEYKRVIDCTREIRPGSKMVLDSFRTVAHMIELISEGKQGGHIDFSGLDDEEIERILRRGVGSE